MVLPELLVLKVAVAVKTAWIKEWFTAVRFETLRAKIDCNTPPGLEMLVLPSEIAPSKNCTVPVGASGPGEAVTVAVNVTA